MQRIPRDGAEMSREWNQSLFQFANRRAVARNSNLKRSQLPIGTVLSYRALTALKVEPSLSSKRVHKNSSAWRARERQKRIGF